MITWVIGAGGLLGQAIARQCGDRYQPGRVPWQDPETARRILHEQARTLESEAGAAPWRVIWAAGAATTSTSRERAMAEMLPFTGMLEGLRSALPQGPGAVFITSSAGGVYAGSEPPPFDAATIPVPLSPYGELKLAQEQAARETLGPLVPVVVGRLSNLYGPGQNLDKLQGLISRLALSCVTQQPVNIFVPLDTIRDYIFADDAARRILVATDEAVGGAPGEEVQIVASGQAATVGQLIRTMGLVTKRRVPVALGTHPSATAQSPDLRLAPTGLPSPLTPLPAGMRSVYADILHRVQRADLAV